MVGFRWPGRKMPWAAVRYCRDMDVWGCQTRCAPVDADEVTGGGCWELRCTHGMMCKGGELRYLVVLRCVAEEFLTFATSGNHISITTLFGNKVPPSSSSPQSKLSVLCCWSVLLCFGAWGALRGSLLTATGWLVPSRDKNVRDPIAQRWAKGGITVASARAVVGIGSSCTCIPQSRHPSSPQCTSFLGPKKR